MPVSQKMVKFNAVIKHRETLGMKIKWMILLFGFGALNAQMFQFITPQMMDKGFYREGEIIRDTLRFVYLGREQLVIQDLKKSCGCTVAQLERFDYQQGDTISLPFEIDTQGFKGRIRKHITIYYKAPDPGRVQFTVMAEVVPLLKVEPAYVRIQQTPDHSRTTAGFEIQNNSNQEIRVLNVQIPKQGVQVKPRKTSIPPGGRVQFQLEVEPAKIKQKLIYLVIETSYQPKRQIRFPVFVR